MQLLEYQTKQYLAQYGVHIPDNHLVSSAEVAYQVLDAMQGAIIIRPQSLPSTAPIYLNMSNVDLEATISDIFYYNERFKMIRNYVIEQVPEITAELDLEIRTARSQGKIQVTVSFNGYTVTERINALLGVQDYQVRHIASVVNLSRIYWDEFIRVMGCLFRCYVDSDAELLRLSKFGLTPKGNFVAIETEMHVDRNAIHRQGNLFTISAAQQIDPIQIRSQKANLSYIPLHPGGTVNCIANGAGLCMALTDIIDMQQRISPASFIDIGDIIKLDRLRVAFDLVHDAPATLIALYGDAPGCELIARTMIDICQALPPQKLVILQLRGRQADHALELVRYADNPSLQPAATITEAITLLNHRFTN